MMPINKPLTGSPMPSVDKALLTLIALAKYGQVGAPLGRIADELGLKRSSLHTTLAALRYRGFVTQVAGAGFYRLGPEAERLARSWDEGLDVRALLGPVIRRLADKLNEVIHVAVQDGTDIVYVDKAESRQPIQAGTAVGLRLPAVTTALGRAMIAAEYKDFGSFAAKFDGSWVPKTKFAPRNIEEAWERIERANRLGYAVDSQENVVGLSAIAVAILRSEAPIAAVSVVTLGSWEETTRSLDEHLTALRFHLDSALSRPYSIATSEYRP